MSNPSGNLSIIVGNGIISNSHEVTVLCITHNNSLNFDIHAASSAKKAKQNYHALARISNYMYQQKLRAIMKAFVTSQFSYCPLIGIKTLSYWGSKTWRLVPDDIKNSKTLSEFKSKFNDWKPVRCNCKLCKTSIPKFILHPV